MEKEQHNEQASSNPSLFQPEPTLRVRCPACSKPFVVKTQNLKVERPRFGCTACDEKFWIPYPECLQVDEIIGFSMSWTDETQQELPEKEAVMPEPLREEEQNVDVRHCPKCSTPMENPYQKECSHCGVVLQKARLLNDSDSRGMQVHPELVQQWKDLLNNFENRTLHREFIRCCEGMQSLDYAAMKYSDVLDGAPENRIAKEFQRQVSLRASMPFEREKKEAPKQKRRFFSLSVLVLILGSAVCAMGFIMPEFRNLVGIGAAMICLTLAIRYYFS